MDAESIADWLEVRLAWGGRQTMSVAEMIEAAADENIATETNVELALNTMDRRMQVGGGARYPFRTTQVSASTVGDLTDATQYDTYLALLALASDASPFRRSQRTFSSAAVVFEWLVAEASRTLLGASARSVRFGSPGEPGRPPDFPGAVRWLAEQMGTPVGSSFRPPSRQDGGVDVVAWRPFADRRKGFPILLAQATLERQFVHKASDVDLRLWAGWLAFDIDPMTALATPYTLGNSEEWNSISARTILLDRLRICQLIEELPGPVRAWLPTQTGRTVAPPE